MQLIAVGDLDLIDHVIGGRRAERVRATAPQVDLNRDLEGRSDAVKMTTPRRSSAYAVPMVILPGLSDRVRRPH